MKQRTEIERIIDDGIIPSSFLLPETICDFHVDEYRKKIWAIEIDLLVKFDEVCRKHNLKYFMSFGSLLGIVRHNGFIPWDDDIDVSMPRADYEKLKKYVSEFEEPYFLQFPGCDEEFFFTMAKLRNSNTSGISSAFRYDHFNQGIWIDIFPMDNCDLNDIDKNAEAIDRLISENSAWMRLNNPHLVESEKAKIQFYKGRKPIEVLNEIESICRQYEGKETDYVTCAILTVYKPVKITYRKSEIDDLVLVDFYGHKVPIPKNFAALLRTTYGDYLQFPPLDKRGSWHNSSYFNPDVPYKESLELLHKKDAMGHNES